MRITLNNKLDEEPGCGHTANINVPHCFNTTNLHAHGLWVSPTGNSDNVLVSIKPGVHFQYEYNVPEDHASGTFWYHPHHHGSTALHVSSGMAGALILKAERSPTADRPGDLDLLLKDKDGTPFPEKVLLFQQIQYACRNKDGKIEPALKDDKTGTPWTCGPDQFGEITGYDQFGPNTQWKDSGRFTGINGRIQPELDVVTAGRFERWRLIHAGVRETVTMRLYPMKKDAPAVPTADKQAEWLKNNCSGEPLRFWEVASDGLTRPRAFPTTQTVLQPGYRADLVTYFPEAGKYCLVDDASTGLTDQAEDRRLLGVVEAYGGTATASTVDPEKFLRDTLVAAAKRGITDAAVRGRVVDDLNAGLKLSSFVWHKSMEKEDSLPKRTLTFNIQIPKSGPAVFQVDGKPYDPKRVDQMLVLDTAEEWVLKSDFVSHPFHIHVNPFQIISIIDPTGKDVSAPDAVDDYVLPGSTPTLPDPQYPGLKGVWKDTLFIKNLVGTPGADPKPGQYTITMRTRYERYIGEFVLHCHILDHEDQGMMQNVKIGVTDGHGGMAVSHDVH